MNFGCMKQQKKISRLRLLSVAGAAMRAGVDWLEAGTPFILAEGMYTPEHLRRGLDRLTPARKTG